MTDLFILKHLFSLPAQTARYRVLSMTWTAIG